MGQKLSELKGVLKNMEDRPDNEIQISLERVHYCTNDVSLPSVSSSASNDNNGNSEVTSSRLNEHFEHIYNTNENREIEDNGNIRNQPSTSEASQCIGSASNYCLNTTKNENTGFFSSDSRKQKSRRNKKGGKSKDGSTKKKRPHWVLRFNCARLKSGSNSSGGSSEPEGTEPNLGIASCICTGYRNAEDHHLEAGVVFEAAVPRARRGSGASTDSEDDGNGFIGFTDHIRYRTDEFALEDCDERARIERAREIAEGMDPPPGFRPGQHIQLLYAQDMILGSLTAFLQSAAMSALSQLDYSRTVHTQVDYIHCLVPDLLQITTCSFYWGKMDRYEAERLLDGKPEGTFLLRDSAQEEYLFSVSFRKFDRSLHARIEQWKHMFSFDSHDPGVYSSPTVCGLIKHYKDPSVCMFFEPLLTIPLHRNFSFPLQHLCRAVICSKISYDGISQLRLPKSLKTYLKEYHYKQRVKVRVFDSE